jgi:uncharacterized protein (TIGR02145 family)
MKKIFLVLLLLTSRSIFTSAQVSINLDGSLPDSSAILDLQSSDRGFLPPRMTQAQRNAIVNPAEGLLVFCNDCSTESTSGILTIFRDGEWRTFEVNCDYPLTPGLDMVISEATQITWDWNTVPISIGYKWGYDDDFNNAEDLGLLTLKVETGLICWSEYRRYVWAYNDCGRSDSLILTASTLPVTFSPAPAEGTHTAASDQITWNWIGVTGAAGYRWSTVNNFYTAEDLGLMTARMEAGLNCGTTYIRYIWAYDDCGYSQPTVLTQATVACSGGCQQFTDSRDGQTYFAVMIDTVCWMAENLNIGTRTDSTVSPSDNGIIEKHCYHDLESQCNVYGGLYPWMEMMQYTNTEGTQGICPSGWHLPTWTEWWNMINYLGGTSIAGGELKEAGYAHWFTPNEGATNESGFTALPGGSHSPGIAYGYMGYSGKFWTSSETPPGYQLKAKSFSLAYNSSAISPSTVTSKYNEFSVRCIKNANE